MAKCIKKKIRGNVICAVCHLHTEQRRLKRGWVCKECGHTFPAKRVEDIREYHEQAKEYA